MISNTIKAANSLHIYWSIVLIFKKRCLHCFNILRKVFFFDQWPAKLTPLPSVIWQQYSKFFLAYLSLWQLLGGCWCYPVVHVYIQSWLKCNSAIYPRLVQGVIKYLDQAMFTCKQGMHSLSVIQLYNET